MNQLTAAMTGHGKTYVSHVYAENNVEDYDAQVIPDYKDEYVGLVERGYLTRLTVPNESQSLTVSGWQRIIEDNARAGGVQLARGNLTDEEWREVCARVVRALAGTDLSVFVTIDEAHRLAPQQEGYPDAYDTLATTWHGDGLGVNWITQRLSLLDSTILAQCQATMLGTFSADADLRKVDRITEYPTAVHNDNVTGEIDARLPEDLQREGKDLPLTRWTDDEGSTVGSEWVWADGNSRRRVDSKNWELTAEHYGYDRKRMNHPFE